MQNFRAQGDPPSDPQHNLPHCEFQATRLNLTFTFGGAKGKSTIATKNVPHLKFLFTIGKVPSLNMQHIEVEIYQFKIGGRGCVIPTPQFLVKSKAKLINVQVKTDRWSSG